MAQLAVLHFIGGSDRGFFFQAEDGIRDKLVTGVQTCALPILALQESIPITRNRSRIKSQHLTRVRSDCRRCAACRSTQEIIGAEISARVSRRLRSLHIKAVSRFR